MFDQHLNPNDQNNLFRKLEKQELDVALEAEEMYYQWHFYASYLITPEMKVYRKRQLVCACQLSVN